MAPIKAYESVFHIDNVPILPPLMTEEKRQKMRDYKDLAIALETKLKLERDVKTIATTIPTIRKISESADNPQSENDDLSSVMTGSTQKTITTTATTPIDNEYLQVSNLLKEMEEPKQQQQQQKINRTKDYLKNLSRSDLFICDVISNTITIPSQDETDPDDDFNHISLEERKENEMKFEDNHVKDSKKIDDNNKESIIQWKPIVQKLSPSSSPIKLLPKRSYNDVQIKLKDHNKEIPSIIIEPPTPLKDKLYQDQILTELKEKIKSPSLKTSPIPNEDQKQIIRSNSFTIDSPSNALIEHIIKCNNNNNQTDGEELHKMIPPSPSLCTKTSNTNNNDKPPTKCVNNVPLSSSCSVKIQKSLKPKKFERKCLKSASDTTKISSMLMSSTNLLFKNKKTPYDVKSISKTSKVLRKHKNHPLNKTTSTNTIVIKPTPPVLQQQRISNKNQRTPMRQKSQLNLRESFPLEEKIGDSNKTISRNSGDNFQQIKEMIEEIEDKHRTKLKELLQKQQEEQRLMQENFEKQQKLLLEKFTIDIKKNVKTTKEPRIKSVWSDEIYLSINKNSLGYNDDDYDDDDNDSEYGSSSFTSPIGPLSLKRVNSNDNLDTTTTRSITASKSSPRKKLLPLNGAGSGGGVGSGNSGSGGSQTSKKLFTNSNLMKKKEGAVTTINAYARGYLTRRLFKTDHVQRIVQTIRDTLLFVLQLHMETRYDDTEDNIKLKARLLQQLTSACENLHNVFSEYSIKERMEIIAKDRKLLKSKANKLRG